MSMSMMPIAGLAVERARRIPEAGDGFMSGVALHLETWDDKRLYACSVVRYKPVGRI